VRADEAWAFAFSQLKQQIGQGPNRAMVEELSFRRFAEGRFLLAVPGEFARDWCESRLAAPLQRQLSGLLGESVQVEFSVWDEDDPLESVPAGTQTGSQFWNRALDALRGAFSRTEMETWVSSASFGSFEDGVFTIRTGSRQTRDWLEAHARPLIRRTLEQSLGTDFELRFDTDAAAAGSASASTPGGPAGVHRPQGSAATPPALTPEEQRSQAEYFIQSSHLSLYDLLVKPEQEIMLPGYLARWIPYLGTTGFMILVGLRQVYYLKNGCHPTDKDVLTARGDEIARWTGLNERTFWRHFDSPQLGYFFRVDQNKRWVNDPDSGRAKRAVNRYIFTASTPLTPGDVQALQGWLAAAGIDCDPVAVLNQALDTPRGQILPPSPQLPAPHLLERSPQPYSVQDVVRLTCGKLPPGLASEVEDLANLLAGHLMPHSDRLFFSWYFLRHWAPALGAAPALMVALLRDRCYSSETERRNRVWVQGGNHEIARWLGLPRPKTVDEWLPPLFERPTSPPADSKKVAAWQERRQRREEKRQLVARFLERSDYRSEDSHYAWEFRVNLNEPLVDRHRQLYELLLDVIAGYLNSRDPAVLQEALLAAAGRISGKGTDDQGRDCQSQAPDKGAIVSFNETQNPDPFEAVKARLSVSMEKQGRECQTEVESKGANVSSPEEGEGAFVSPAKARLSQLKTLLKNTLGIKTLETYFNHLQRAAEAYWQEQESRALYAIKPEVVDSKNQWDLKGLLVHNHVSPAKQKALLQEPGVSAQDFVAGLLYAASPAGESIRYPLNQVLALLESGDVRGDALQPDAFLRLAAREPAYLALLLASHLDGASRADADWQAAMMGADPARLQALAEMLGMEMRRA
jgi:hypothetical protein